MATNICTRHIRTVAAISTTAFVLASCGSSAQSIADSSALAVASTTTQPVDVEAGSPTDGAWLRNGYGQVFVVDNAKVTEAWMPAGEWCTEIPGLPDGIMVEHTGEAAVALVGEPDIQLTRTELPTACVAGDDPPPRATIEAFVTLMDTHYPFFAERDIDWPVERSALLAQAESVPSAMAAATVVADFIAGMGDGHMSIDVPSNVDDPDVPGVLNVRERAIEASRIDALLGETRTEAAGGLVVFGQLVPDVGYLAITQMIGYSSDGTDEASEFGAVLDEALAAVGGNAKLVVDVRGNGGGTDVVSLEAISRFVSEPTDLYTKEPHADPSAQRTISVDPSDAIRFDGDVVVLVDGGSASAAEIFGAGMHRIGATIVGTPTEGIFSDINSVALPGGFEVDMSNEVYRDVVGEPYEVRGVPLTVATDAPGAFAAAFDTAELALVNEVVLDDAAITAATSDSNLLRVEHGQTCRAVISLEASALADRAGELCEMVFARVVAEQSAETIGAMVDGTTDPEPILFNALVAVVTEASEEPTD